MLKPVKVTAEVTRVLIVEDDPIFRLLLDRCLNKQSEERGVKMLVTLTDSFAGALVKLKEQVFDLVLLDLNLPDSQGRDTYVKLLQQLPTQAVVVLTAEEDEEMAADAVRSGAQDFLIKNYTEPVRLLRVVLHAIDRHRKTIEIIDAHQNTQRSQRMIALGTMVSGIAHEYNNLNAVVMGNVELMLRKSTDERSIKSLNRCLDAVRRSSEITRGLLDFARDSQAAFAVINVNELMEDTIELAGPEIEGSKIELVKQGFQDPVYMNGNAGQIGQVFLNVIINACHSMRGRTKRTLTISVMEEHGQVVVAIEDTGCGMTEEQLARAFDPFYSTKSPAQQAINVDQVRGTGLGLSICETMTRHHGGTIVATSVVTEGSRFVVSFPIDQNKLDRAAIVADNRKVEIVDLRGKYILVVDDELEIIEILSAMLEEWGCEVAIAGSAEAAIGVLKTVHPQVIISDWSMPGIGGEGLLRILATGSETARIPVIVMTGLAEHVRTEQAHHGRFSGILRKPFTGNQLQVALIKALTKFQL